MKTPVEIVVTGAAGHISYSLLFRLAAGELLGLDQPIVLRLLEITPALNTLAGVVMELNDCAYPLLHKIIVTDDPEVAFQGVEYAFLVGAKPRQQGMLRSDLLEQNAAIFAAQGRVINQVANPKVKVLVTGNPANTNALIAIKNAPDLPANCFSSMAMLDHTRAISQLALKCEAPVTAIKNVIIWGNHSCTQYPDLHHAKVNDSEALSLVEHDWYIDQFIPTVQYRGTEVIKARGQSSAASAAHAAIQHMRTLVYGTAPGTWVSMGVASDGSYGVPEGLVFSFPVTIQDGQISIVQGLELNEFSLEKLRINQEELIEERQAIKHLL